MASLLHILITSILITIPLIIYRLQVILNPERNRAARHGRRDPDKSTHLLIVLGSGGHTAEMIAMLDRAVNEKNTSRRLDWRDYTHRTWLVGSGDTISTQRAKDFEEMAIRLSTQSKESTEAEGAGAGSSAIVTVSRARQIHQSLFTAPISSLRCMLACLIVLLQHPNDGRGFPDLILCNGPATATILIFTSVLLRFFNVGGCETNDKMRTIYVESWARVKKLSLSGVLLSRVVDRFLVQWPQLEENTRGRAEYLGVLV